MPQLAPSRCSGCSLARRQPVHAPHVLLTQPSLVSCLLQGPDRGAATSGTPAARGRPMRPWWRSRGSTALRPTTLTPWEEMLPWEGGGAPDEARRFSLRRAAVLPTEGGGATDRARGGSPMKAAVLPTKCGSAPIGWRRWCYRQSTRQCSMEGDGASDEARRCSNRRAAVLPTKLDGAPIGWLRWCPPESGAAS